MSAHKTSLRDHEASFDESKTRRVAKQSLPNQIAASFVTLTPRNDKSGFTLVELLVVITIIAILSIIGIVIFTGVQKGARDARRKGDIDAISKAMEVNYGRFKIGQYAGLCQITTTPTYDCSQWFSGGLPKDPTGTISYHWCDPTDAANNPVCVGINPIGDNAPQKDRDWMVCANLEVGGKFCISNRQ